VYNNVKNEKISTYQVKKNKGNVGLTNKTNYMWNCYEKEIHNKINLIPVNLRHVKFTPPRKEFRLENITQ